MIPEPGIDALNTPSVNGDSLPPLQIRIVGATAKRSENCLGIPPGTVLANPVTFTAIIETVSMKIVPMVLKASGAKLSR
jgi:hypothetical protein